MKIALYGCSFVNESTAFQKNPGRAWSKILKEDYGWNITNFSEHGSGVYYSYLKFKETHEVFDKVIFSESYSDRIYVPNMENTSCKHLSPTTHKNPALTKNELEIVKSYWTFIHNPKERKDMAELMENEIKFLRPDALYIKAKEIFAMICSLDHPIMDQITENAIIDPRYCHINNLNNIIFASKINDWLNGNTFMFDLKDFKPIEQYELNMYYEFYYEYFNQ